jgi:hypothetical protein
MKSMQDIKPEIQRIEVLKELLAKLMLARYNENRIKGLGTTEAETEKMYSDLSKVQIELIGISIDLDFKRRNKHF